MCPHVVCYIIPQGDERSPADDLYLVERLRVPPDLNVVAEL